MTTTPLRLHAVSHRFGSGPRAVTALDNVSLSIAPGELVAVMGPSGSGKSTLLNVAGLLLTPDTGQVVVDGTDAARLSPRRAAEVRRRHIGVVFQSSNMLPTLTLGENVALPLELDGRRTGEARDQAAAALAEVGLDGLADRFPEEVSGGQVQRAAIARALVGKRSILLADEPTGALDSATADDVIAVLRARIDAGSCGVLVTHEPRFAAYADRMVILRDGHLKED